MILFKSINIERDHEWFFQAEKQVILILLKIQSKIVLKTYQ
jgi:hypothetical protein